jgi:hypothetical protein
LYVGIISGSEDVVLTFSPLQAYITGNAFVILGSPDTILQTVYDDDDTPLDAIAVDEVSGKIASCAGHVVRVYRPYGQAEDSLKVCQLLNKIWEICGL